jgi:hypothetical protein
MRDSYWVRVTAKRFSVRHALAVMGSITAAAAFQPCGTSGAGLVESSLGNVADVK